MNLLSIPRWARLRIALRREKLRFRSINNARRMLYGNRAKATFVFGAYSGQNLGDMALGEALRSIRGSRLHLLDIDGLSGFPHPNMNPLILGGGSIVGVDNIRRLQRLNINPGGVEIMGVNFIGLTANWPKDVRDWVGACRHVIFRTSRELQIERMWLESATYAPDLAFCLNFPSWKGIKSGRIGINILPHFYRSRGFKYVPGHGLEDFFKQVDPFHYQHITEIGPAYVALVRNLVAKYSPHYNIEHIPFALEDELFAKVVFTGLPVKLIPYTENRQAVCSRMSSFEWFFATRYHAHVFAISIGLPVVGVLYGQKCMDLIADLGLSKRSFLQNTELVERNFSSFINQIPQAALMLEDATREQLQKDAISAYSK